MTDNAATIRDMAAKLYEARRLRDRAFGADREGFGEPAWDMLLGVMARDGPASADEVLRLAGAVPVSTAQTYLQWLASRNLIVLGDRVVPTARAYEAMRGYLVAAHQ